MIIRKISNALKMVVRSPRGFLKYILGSVEKYRVYMVEPGVAEVGDRLENIRLVALKEVDAACIRRFASASEDAEAALRHGIQDGYGLLAANEIVHVSYMIQYEADQRAGRRRFGLQKDEAEITHSFTLTSHRGRGYYPCAIRLLCRLAVAKGVERVFMVTNPANLGSRRGILKAGLRDIGSMWRWVLPWLCGGPILTIRRFSRSAHCRQTHYRPS